MNRVMLRVVLMGCAALFAGCISSQTRLPTLAFNRDSRAERQTYLYHNPLPDPNLGPAIERPRGMEDQRPEPRRSQEVRGITDGIVGTSGVSTGSNPAVSRYPASVSP